EPGGRAAEPGRCGCHVHPTRITRPRSRADLDASAASISGTVRIAAFRTTAHAVIPAALSALAQAHPALRAEVTEREPGLARRFTPAQWQAIEHGVAAVTERMLSLLPAERAAALAGGPVTIDLDTTDVEVYGRQKRGVAYSHQGQRVLAEGRERTGHRPHRVRGQRRRRPRRAERRRRHR
ncbi:MAG TPA: hypothetical protein VFQ68_14050, partial [Streptosporangiaceae bacterium]|nr:hypothetical protein [Streptosporangiaceae bacterium]